MSLKTNRLLQKIDIQSSGGTRKTVQKGIDLIKEMLPEVNRSQREVVSASHIILGLECGGSDIYSGITANPALGYAVNLLVQQGGTAILSETPEIYGAEHLLVSRAINENVKKKLMNKIKWWEESMLRFGGELNNNVTPGNKDGGLTSIFEKSLGAVSKAGSTKLVDVYEYAEQVVAKGLVFMDTPGYDPVSVTGMVAGGANSLCFTTGRGAVCGFKPVPAIKLSSNTAVYKRLEDDMDLNCGTIVDGEATVEDIGKLIFRLILKTASGQKTKSEEIGFGDNEFIPWYTGLPI
jgi:altronate hydrolase